MSGRALAAAALIALPLLGACRDPSEPAAVPMATQTADAAAVPSGPASASARASAGAPPPAWSWQGADPNIGGTFYTAPIHLDTRLGRCRFVFQREARTTTTDCGRADDKSGRFDRLWGIDESGAFVEDAAMVADTARLYVARFSNISTGCELSAYKLESGELVWHTRLVGLGSVAHSEYWNEVQIELHGDRAIKVLGWEAAGRYIEIVDIGSGRTDSTLRVDPSGRLTDVPGPGRASPPEAPRPGAARGVDWKWDGPELYKKQTEEASLTANGKTCSFTVDREARRSHLACKDAKGKRLWGVDRADQFGPAGALATDGTRLYFADHTANSTGARVLAFDIESGQHHWTTELFGMGPVSHSKYRNAVVMRVESGRLVVSGWESEGKYVEVLDPSNGAPLGNRREP